MWFAVVMRLPPWTLRDGDRAVLEAWVRVGDDRGSFGETARIVLLAAEGMPNRGIASVVRLHYKQVGMWRARYSDLVPSSRRSRWRPSRATGHRPQAPTPAACGWPEVEKRALADGEARLTAVPPVGGAGLRFLAVALPSSCIGRPWTRATGWLP